MVNIFTIFAKVEQNFIDKEFTEESFKMFEKDINNFIVDHKIKVKTTEDIPLPQSKFFTVLAPIFNQSDVINYENADIFMNIFKKYLLTNVDKVNNIVNNVFCYMIENCETDLSCLFFIIDIYSKYLNDSIKNTDYYTYNSLFKNYVTKILPTLGSLLRDLIKVRMYKIVDYPYDDVYRMFNAFICVVSIFFLPLSEMRYKVLFQNRQIAFVKNTKSNTNDFQSIADLIFKSLLEEDTQYLNSLKIQTENAIEKYKDKLQLDKYEDKAFLDFMKNIINLKN